MNKFSTKWYTRQDKTISGPFTKALLKSNLQLGRINAQTEVSTDQKYWQPLGDIIALETDDPVIPPRYPWTNVMVLIGVMNNRLPKLNVKCVDNSDANRNRTF